MTTPTARPSSDRHCSSASGSKPGPKAGSNSGPNSGANAAKNTWAIQDALHQSNQWARIGQILQASQLRWESARTVIPEPLLPSLLPSSFDNGRWCILTHHASAATKLKQIIPDILRQLESDGLLTTTIQVKISKPPVT